MGTTQAIPGAEVSPHMVMEKTIFWKVAAGLWAITPFGLFQGSGIGPLITNTDIGTHPESLGCSEHKLLDNKVYNTRKRKA